MKNEQHKKIFLELMNHLNTLNELLNGNNNIEPNSFIRNLNHNKIELDTEDLNIFLSSITLLSFKQKKEIITIKDDNNAPNKIIIVTFLNTILENLNIEEIELEVIK